MTELEQPKYAVIRQSKAMFNWSAPNYNLVLDQGAVMKQ